MLSPEYAWLLANAITKAAPQVAAQPSILMQRMSGMVMLTWGAKLTTGYERLARAWRSLTTTSCENNLFDVRVLPQPLCALAHMSLRAYTTGCVPARGAQSRFLRRSSVCHRRR